MAPTGSFHLISLVVALHAVRTAATFLRVDPLNPGERPYSIAGVYGITLVMIGVSSAFSLEGTGGRIVPASPQESAPSSQVKEVI